MAERKPLSKKIRFEVFKRDCFTCQYCGRKTPDVILEVDHITPVSKGGDNNIINLVTACRDCNRGKTNTELSDEAVVIKERKQVEMLAERRQQVEMYAEFRKQLMKEQEYDLDCLVSYFEEIENCTLTTTGRSNMRKLLKNYGYEAVCDAIDIATMRYSDVDVAFDKIGGICYNKANQDTISRAVNQVAYLLRKNGYRYVNKMKLKQCFTEAKFDESDIEIAKHNASVYGNWTSYINWLEEYCNREGE